ncbi:hypothetical protein EVJ58_g2806 [Rhodofomes roseus]|uniref:C2H2-type domain-containing protein n=1 Tax=Rhodofomes roseus TaxID=34475 RepID=A0A4Y9YQT2_9APHY|nr:hypothetical protein EVJ58_g2806 [Rhodofomes roseus]
MSFKCNGCSRFFTQHGAYVRHLQTSALPACQLARARHEESMCRPTRRANHRRAARSHSTSHSPESSQARSDNTRPAGEDNDNDSEDNRVEFEGDFFGSAEDYDMEDLPFSGDDDKDPGEDGEDGGEDDGEDSGEDGGDEADVDESSDDEPSDEEAVGLDIIEPSNEVERDGRQLPPLMPDREGSASPNQDHVESEHAAEEAFLGDPPVGRGSAPGGLQPAAHEQIRQPPSYVVPFPGGKAGKPVPPSSRQASKPGYDTYAEMVDPQSNNPYAPFTSKMDWEIARWAKLRGSGSTAFSDLLAIPEVRERLGVSYKNSDQLNKIIDEKLPTRRPMFQRFEVSIGGERFEMFKRDVLECALALWGDGEHTPYLCFSPERHYADADHTVRLYHDLKTGEWWWATQKMLEAKQPGATVMPIIISSDKTQLTTFRDKTAYPVYLTIGNLPKEIRRKPSHRGQILLAYLPASRLQHIKNKAARRRTLANVFHACLSMILEPLRKAGVDGVEMTSGDGVVRRCHPILAVYVGDYPEQVLVTGTYTGQCPICKCPHDELGNYPRVCPYRDVDEVLDALHLFGTADYNHACEAAGIKPIQHPFWEHLPYVDIFRSITPDILHQLHQGVIKHLLAWITDIVGKDEVDARVKRLPPSHGMRVFHKGISGLSRVTGTEHKQIARFILGVLVDVPLPRSDSSELISATKALLDFLYVSQYPVHSNMTLDALEHSLSEFHARKGIFVKLGARDHFHIPKLHMLTHYVRAIKYFGTTDNYNTEATERLHIDFAKDAYRATNHKDEFPQMTKWLERREKVLQHADYIGWRLLRAEGGQDGTITSRQGVRWRPPDMACTLHHLMTKYPSRKAVPVAELVSPEGYGATYLMPALARFLIEHNNPLLSRNEVEARAQYIRFPFTALPVFHKVKFRNVKHHGKETLDSIHARPRQQGRNSEVMIPSRFDTALVHVRPGPLDGRAEPREGLSVSIIGYACFIVAEALVLLSTWWHTYGLKKLARENNQEVSLTDLLLRDGTVYFGLMFLLEIFASIGQYVTALEGAPAFVFALEAILLSRFILNLRRVALQLVISNGRQLGAASFSAFSSRLSVSELQFDSRVLGTLGGSLALGSSYDGETGIIVDDVLAEGDPEYLEEMAAHDERYELTN